LKEELLEAFEHAVEALARSGADYALIGGFATAFHGIPRPTRDIDFLYSTPRVNVSTLLARFRELGFSFDEIAVLRELGEDHLSTLRHGGVPVDLLDAVVPPFQRAVKRARQETLHGRRVRIAAPEDLILLKLIAAREDDLRDIRGILATQGDLIQLDDVRKSLKDWCEDDRGDIFERLVREVGAGPT
jgi:predicted nucleotidyltransferase